MFENFRSGDFSQSLGREHFAQNINLVKSNFISELPIEEVVENKETGELFKGYDFKSDYAEYLSKRRGEMKKDIPLYKMINTQVTNVNELDSVKIEDRMFKSLGDFEEFDTAELVKGFHKQEIEQMSANTMWILEKNENILTKTIEAMYDLYSSLVQPKIETDSKVSIESLKNDLLTKGFSEINAIILSELLHKSSFEDNEDELIKKYVGFKKLEEKLGHKKGVSNPKALSAWIGRKKWGSKKMEEASKEDKPVTKV
jgi:hypothetical protein